MKVDRGRLQWAGPACTGRTIRDDKAEPLSEYSFTHSLIHSLTLLWSPVSVFTMFSKQNRHMNKLYSVLHSD